MKDAEDVEGILRVQWRPLDWDYVYGWADKHGTRMLLDRLRNQAAGE